MTSDLSSGTAPGNAAPAIDESPNLDRAGFEILEQAACLDLLSSATLGRVGVSIEALPAIFPVNYCLVGGEIMFLTGQGTKLTAALSGTVVAFEVDWADEGARQAWSVQVVGVSRVVENVIDVATVSLFELHSWAPVPRPYLVRITPERISGRRLNRSTVQSS